MTAAKGINAILDQTNVFMFDDIFKMCFKVELDHGLLEIYVTA